MAASRIVTMSVYAFVTGHLCLYKACAYITVMSSFCVSISMPCFSISLHNDRLVA